MKRLATSLLTLLVIVPTTLWGQSDTSPVKTPAWLPEVHGTIRAKYEYQPEINSGRFQVRNARFSLTGKVHPMVSYKAEIDLSDEGSIKMLDAYTRLSPFSGFNFTIGQMKVPFTIDNHRSPHSQYFANRSFIAKQVGNVRDVGATAAYRFSAGCPVILEAGLFNGSGLTNQKVWHDVMNYSAKAQIFFRPDLNLTLSVQTIKPQDVRIRMYDVGAYYKWNNFHVEAEYLYKTYNEHAFQDVEAFNSFINYDWKLKKGLEKISFLLRYDRMSNHSNGIGDDSGKLKVNDYGRQRWTGGMTFSIGKPFIADIRLNYEKYVYKHGSTIKESEQDKFVLEFMTRF